MMKNDDDDTNVVVTSRIPTVVESLKDGYTLECTLKAVRLVLSKWGCRNMIYLKKSFATHLAHFFAFSHAVFVNNVASIHDNIVSNIA